MGQVLVFEGAFQDNSDKLSMALNGLTGLFDVFSGIFTGNWELVWHGVQEVFLGVWDGIKSWFENILNTMQSILDVIYGWFGTAWKETWNSISSFFTDIWNGISTFFSDTWNNTTSFCSDTWNRISQTCASIWNEIKESIINPIQEAWNSVCSVFGKSAAGLRRKLKRQEIQSPEQLMPLKGSLTSSFTGLTSLCLIFLFQVL